MGPTGHARVLQIHPTKRCNLTCLHCYSASGPHEATELEPEVLESFLLDAAAEGYTVASFSGGEPTLYQPLYELLTYARALGLKTTITTNGMLLDERRLEKLRGKLDLLAISLDGVPASHNTMRNAPRAFEAMVQRLEGVRQSGIPFGFIFTLTQYNLNELEWVAHFAAEQGARLLQVHPLENVGRAQTGLGASLPDELEAAMSYFEVNRLRQRYAEQLYIQYDLVSARGLAENPARVYADEVGPDAESRALSELLSPLVVEPSGEVVPLRYGFPRAFALGNLREHRLCALAGAWRAEKLKAFRQHCRRVLDEIVANEDAPVVGWYEQVAQVAS